MLSEGHRPGENKGKNHNPNDDANNNDDDDDDDDDADDNDDKKDLNVVLIGSRSMEQLSLRIESKLDQRRLDAIVVSDLLSSLEASQLHSKGHGLNRTVQFRSDLDRNPNKE